MKFKTFTLIEMLIVIVIIGILAAALVPRLQAVQGRARDTKRKADLKMIADANQIYLLDNGDYGFSSGCALNTNGPGCASQSLNTQPRLLSLTGYMTTVPVDPINSYDPANASTFPTVTGNYNYIYFRVFNAPVDTYTLMAQLENPQDPLRNGVQQYKSQSTVAGATFSRVHHQIYVISPNMGLASY